MKAIEPYFDFIERRKKPWILVIMARGSAELTPHLSAPSGRTATLVRRPSDEIVLDYIPRSVRKHLETARKIIVAEVDRRGEAVRIYISPVEHF